MVASKDGEKVCMGEAEDGSLWTVLCCVTCIGTCMGMYVYTNQSFTRDTILYFLRCLYPVVYFMFSSMKSFSLPRY